MTIPGLSYPDLAELKPCALDFKRVTRLMGGAKKWNGVKITAQQAREAGATFNDIVWVASIVAQTDKDVERRIRLWIADCAARVLHIYELDYPADARPRNAILAARQYARSEIEAAAMDTAGDTARVAARATAWAAARAAARAAGWATAWDTTWDTAGDTTWDTARSAARAAAEAAAGDPTGAAARAAAGDTARDTEKSWQFDRLIAWLSDPEPDDLLLPARQKSEAA